MLKGRLLVVVFIMTVLARLLVLSTELQEESCCRSNFALFEYKIVDCGYETESYLTCRPCKSQPNAVQFVHNLDGILSAFLILHVSHCPGMVYLCRYVFPSEAGNVTSKHHGVICYRYCLLLRSIALRSNTNSGVPRG
jgi:hypothetical protein